MQNKVTLLLQKGEHTKRHELVEFLRQVASVTDNLIFEEGVSELLSSPISFLVKSDERDTGIRFSGIPSGHEFNSLILAILQASGTELKLDDSIKSLVQKIKEPLHFESFVSLSCHNCPDVVQTLNQFALLNSNISSEMIDGALFQDTIKERNIQGVPTVYLNGELFASGKVDAAQLVDKLLKRFPHLSQTNSESQLPTQDVTVIGGGPAGVAAAIYAARKGLKVTLIADRIGGQVKDTVAIENLISVPKTTGTELSNSLLQHMLDYSITLKQHLTVEAIKPAITEQGQPESNQQHQLILSSGESFDSKTIIIATGAKWRELNIPGEKENIGNGVAYCPHCDGPFFKNKKVAVIGGGNSGIEAALDLAGITESVTVLEFLPELKADQVLQDQVAKRSNIRVIKNVVTKQIIAESGKVTAIEYECRETGNIKQQELAGVFVQVGLKPNSELVEGIVERTQFGEIIINERGETSTSGIFACGDVTTVPYKQIVIAMGEGAKTALSAFDYLLKQ